jgi:hypothetical protein
MMKKLFMSVALLCVLSMGCVSGDLHEAYVEADRETYNAVAPKMRELLSAAPQEEQDDYNNLLDSWDARTSRAEGQIKADKAKAEGGAQ